MKKLLFMAAALLTVLLSSSAVFGQPGTSATEHVPAAFSSDMLWSYLISAVTPVVIWLLTKIAPKVPKPLLPTLTPVIGILIGVALNALAAANIGWIDMAKAGALAVFIREAVNQWITKKLAEDAKL